MRSTFLAIAGLAVAACGQPEPETAVLEQENAIVETPTPSLAIDGWEIDQTAYAKINTPIVAITGAKTDGSAFDAGSLGGRWTILGLWSSPPPADEASFTAALSSAADQHPDLDVLVIHAAGSAPPWLLMQNNGLLLSTLTPPTSPAYLLVGPDLNIEAYRGALSAMPNDGIKSVIRGVAEVRKQISVPQ
jgi:hypothetical protein